LLNRPEKWWLFLLAIFPIRVLSSGITEILPLWLMLTASALDALKGFIAASALRRVLRDPIRLDALQSFWIFCLIAVVLVPGLFAFAAALLRTGVGGNFWATWQQWFLGDALAEFIFTPAILYLYVKGRSQVQTLSATRRMEGVTLLGGLIIVAYFAGTADAKSVMLTEPRFYAPIVFLLWAAIRFGMLGASVALSVWALIFTSAAAAAAGPFASESARATAVLLQSYLLPRALTIYFIALSLEQLTRANKYLMQSEQRFRDMANAAPALVWTSGRDKLCDFFNEGWLAFTGRTLEAELGAGWTDGVHPEDLQQCLKSYDAAFDARQPFKIEYRLRRHDGEYRWIRDRGVPRYDPDGEFAGYFGFCIDIQDRRDAEELSNSMNHVQRLAAVGEMSAAMAHELAQPLSAVVFDVATAKKLLDAKNPSLPEIRAILDEVDQSLVRVTEVFKTTRKFLSRRATRMGPVDVYALVSDLLVLLASESVRRSVHITTNLQSGLPRVLGDRTQLQQVLLNLVVNGMEAMENTRPDARQLTINCRAIEGRLVEFEVVDHGCGIPLEKLPGAFAPFFTTKEHGLGLGLSIAQSIVRSHQGRIWAENTPYGGAAFHFTVPMAEAATQERPQPSAMIS
jgi:PAS domain S-box-containing protein